MCFLGGPALQVSWPSVMTLSHASRVLCICEALSTALPLSSPLAPQILSFFIVYPSSVGNILSSAECHPNLSDKLMLLFLPFWLLGTHSDFCTQSYFLVHLFPPLRTLEVFKGKATHSQPSVRCVGLGRTGAQRAGKEWILQPKIETGKVGFSLQCANAHLFIK